MIRARAYLGPGWCAIARPRLDARGAARPIRVAKLALDELPRGVARQRVVERYLARDLVAGHVLAAEGDDLLRAERGARLELKLGVHALAPVLVGDAEDGGVEDLRMPVERVLDLGRVDIHARRDDHVALPVAYVIEALGVHPGYIAHRVPIVPADLPRRLGVLVVLVEHAREGL